MPVESEAPAPLGLAAPLLAWYDRNARDLPWRLPPGTPAVPDPYRVWLAEVMLQQTTVEAAREPYARFLARWPTVAALAAADDAEVMAAWAGLGYYARARNLLRCARTVAAAGGTFPRSEGKLRRLPGLGPYTAAAVAALAFGARTLPVDANVARVGARLFALQPEGPALLRAVGERLRPEVPADRPGDFAQALMDLGALVCRPRAPDCPRCPLAARCHARALGLAEAFPRRTPRRARPTRRGSVWWVEADGRVALVRRPPRGLLAGMLALPGTGWSAEQPRALPFPGDWRWAAEPVRHGFTHFDLVLEVAGIRLAAPPAFAEGLIWTSRDSLAGLPTVFRKAAAVGRELARA